MTDKEYFSRWWRDKALLKLTSGVLKLISDREVDKYFQMIIKNRQDYHFMITLNNKVIGHIALAKRKNHWFEIQIVIGEKNYWGRGYGTEAIKQLIRKAKRLKITKIYLEVRPTNSRAIGAYQNSGFKSVKTVLNLKNKNFPRLLRMELR